MKVLIINTLYHPYKVGGAEVSVQLLAEGLVAEGNTVRVVALHDKATKKMDVVNGVEVSYLPLFNKYWPYSNYMPTKIEKMVWHLVDTYNIVMAKRVKNEILQFQPDVVHTNNLAGFSVAVWDVVKKHNIKLVHTSRDYYLFHPNCNLFKNGNIQSVTSPEVKFWSFFKKRMSKRVDCYVGISQFIEKFHIENGFFENKESSYIYNAVEKIEKENFSIGKKTIGFIGRLNVEKGFDEFCEIAEKYQDQYNFVAAGKFANNNESQHLKDLSKRCNVELLGFVSLKDFINKVDAVILPVKWNEPFGRVVVECALAGLTVYTNKLGGITELFEQFKNIELLNLEDIGFEREVKIKKDINLFSSRNISEKYLKIYQSLNS